MRTFRGSKVKKQCELTSLESFSLMAFKIRFLITACVFSLLLSCFAALTHVTSLIIFESIIRRQENLTPMLLPYTLRVCRTHAVFTVAEFYMEYQLVYRVPSCDYQLFNLKQQQLHEFVCQKSVEECPFHTTASCHHLTTNVITLHAADPASFDWWQAQ